MCIEVKYDQKKNRKNAKTYKSINRLVLFDDNDIKSIRNFFASCHFEQEKNDEDQQVILYDRCFFLKIYATINGKNSKSKFPKIF